VDSHLEALDLCKYTFTHEREGEGGMEGYDDDGEEEEEEEDVAADASSSRRRRSTKICISCE
jgi:hypothetical protein